MLPLSRIATSLAVCAAFFLATSGYARQDRVTESEARSWAAEASVISKENVKTFNREFEKRAKKRIRDYRPDGSDITPMRSRGLFVTLYGQVAAFQFSASERVRRLQAIGEATWRPGVTILITVKEMTAQQIERAVVKRGDTIVEPSLNLVSKTEVRNLQGAVFEAREGSLIFPVSVFEPAKRTDIRIILIPFSGSNTEIRVSSWNIASTFERPR